MDNIKHLRPMNTDSKDLLSMLISGGVKILPPFIVGIMAKVANDIRDGRKMSVWGWCAIVVMSLSGTFLSNWICESYNVSKNTTVIINAFATLFSEQLFKILFSNFFIFVQGWVKENLKFTLKSMDKNATSTGTPNTPPPTNTNP